jgi:hypothetical protein
VTFFLEIGCPAGRLSSVLIAVPFSVEAPIVGAANYSAVSTRPEERFQP